MNTARNWVTPLELAALGAIWGGSFLLMRIAAPAFGPLPLVEMRLAFGGLLAGFAGVVVLASGKSAGADVSWAAVAGTLAAAWAASR